MHPIPDAHGVSGPDAVQLDDVRILLLFLKILHEDRCPFTAAAVAVSEDKADPALLILVQRLHEFHRGDDGR